MLCCVALSATLAEAQPAPASKPADTATEKLGRLEFDSEVTVTGTRTESPRTGGPVSTTVVTKDELSVRNVPTLDRAIELTPGVYVFRARGNADILSRVMMRGFNGGNRTLTLLDGMPLNDAYTGEVTWTSLPTDEVERVEVVRGPFSSLYGGNAMGGVINVLTRPIERRQLLLALTSIICLTHICTAHSITWNTGAPLWVWIGTAARSSSGCRCGQWSFTFC